MRIAYVVNSLEGGGAALPLAAVLDVLRAGGAEVDLYALAVRDGRATPALRAAGFEPRTPPQALGRLEAALWLARELGVRRPDLIWTSLTQATLTGQAVGLRLGVPVVSWQHNAFLKPANLRALRATAALTRLWIADSEAVADLTAARLRVPRGRVRVWPLYRAGAIPQAAHPAQGDVWRIGALGRLHPNKGFDTLLAALARLGREEPQASGRLEIVIAGEGAERARLEAEIRRTGAPCRLAGFVDDPAGFLQGLQGYVQPSRAEGLCISAHQGLEAGLPAVVTDVGEMAATVRALGDGWVVPPEDPEALMRALLHMRGDPRASRERGARGRALVLERYGAEAFVAAGRDALQAARRLSTGRGDR